MLFSPILNDFEQVASFFSFQKALIVFLTSNSACED